MLLYLEQKYYFDDGNMGVNDKVSLSSFLEWVRKDILEHIILLSLTEITFDGLVELMTSILTMISFYTINKNKPR